MAQKLNTELIISRFKQIHGDKYDYSKFEYVRSIDKSIIICPEHGEFKQSANVHLRGVGCPKCGKECKKHRQSITPEVFLFRANKKHNNKYQYDLTDFKNSTSTINILCQKHGWFKQNVTRHMCGQGCPKCAKEIKSQKMANSQTQFIDNAIKIHGNKYDYSNVKYINNKTKVSIICPEHGEFQQRPDMHLRHGCFKCVGRNLSLEDFITQAKKIHGDNYDYSNSDYIQSDKKIKIKCNKCNHIFWQKPWSHLQKHGCPNCCSSKGEELISNLLQENNISYIYQKRFPEWLGLQSLDFYLPEYNIAIEYQGIQHFKLGGWNINDEVLENIIRRDKIKYKLCKENNIHLLYFTKEKNIPENYIGEIYTNEKDLINRINNLINQNETGNL